MDWQQTYQRLQSMVGLKLRSISGKTDITPTEVRADTVTIRGQAGLKSRPTDELKRIVAKMDLGQPIHVDSILFGSGSSRNQPETILANMPDVEWLNLNGRKHIVWMGKKSHEIGTLKEIGEFEATQIRARFRGRGPLTGRHGTTVIVRARELARPSQLLGSILQGISPNPIPGTQAYRLPHNNDEIILLADSNASPAIEIIPTFKVVDRAEAIERIRVLFPDLVIQTVNLDREITIVRLPNSALFALE